MVVKKHAVCETLIIPHANWFSCGAWQDTLRAELATLPPEITSMCVKSTTVITDVGHPYVYDLHGHSRGGQWEPIKKLPGYEYCWETVDGRTLDELNIYGPFDSVLLMQIIENFEKRGLNLRSRWDLLITFGK